MALFDKLKNGLYGLKGQAGPTFENEGQRTSSNIQALSKNNILISSQDMISGRTTSTTKIKPSVLDLNGKTPDQYTQILGSTNSSKSTFSSNSGFTLDKRLPFSPLGLGGKPGATFESVSQQSTSNIQALAKDNLLQSSQDLLTGRKYGRGRFSVFVPASTLDGNGIPIGGVYKDKGPKEGRY
jgi:hypothetical protein